MNHKRCFILLPAKHEALTYVPLYHVGVLVHVYDSLESNSEAPAILLFGMNYMY